MVLVLEAADDMGDTRVRAVLGTLVSDEPNRVESRAERRPSQPASRARAQTCETKMGKPAAGTTLAGAEPCAVRCALAATVCVCACVLAGPPHLKMEASVRSRYCGREWHTTTTAIPGGAV